MVLESFGIMGFRGKEPIPDGAQAAFVFASSMFDEPHLGHDDADQIGGGLQVLTSLKYGFLYKLWPHAVYVRMLQSVFRSPPCSGDLVQAKSAGPLTTESYG